MRTALVLLFLLAIAAVPGSLLPQRPLNPTKVDAYLSTHGAWGHLLDRLGFFDVFASVWFAAVYLLLAVSLIGCLVPRLRVYARALRARPLPAPARLSRLPESDTFTVDGDPPAATQRLRQSLGRRWRTELREDGPDGLTVSAEKGYSREAGNLVFHVALLGALVAIAVGRLWGYQGSIVVQEGGSFCNTVLAYDSFKPGRFARDGNVAPFCVDRLRRFTATYLDTGEPSKFSADVTYSRGVDGAPQDHTITVNHPLRLEGDRVYLIGHGFAPRITVRGPDGRSITDTASFIPQDATTFYSEGAFKIPGPPNRDGTHSHDIGVQGYFAPTPATNAGGVITSTAPQARNPVLGLQFFQGDLGNTGTPQSVYSLSQEQLASGALKKVAMKDLRQGQSVRLPDGTTVSFDGWVQWASIQVSHDPAQGWLLVFATAMVVGLIGSLAVRRRRVWLRLRPATPNGAGGTSARTVVVVEVGGLARSDSGNFSDEFAGLVFRLRGADGDAEAGTTGFREGMRR